MIRKARARIDPLERAVEAALMPGRFVAYRGSFDFTRELGQVERQLQRLIPREPARAIALYEAFLAGCYEKAEEIDDSSGSFGQFVGELFCGWIRARQAVGADPAQTAARLLAWMDDDPYGFASDLDSGAAKALDMAGLAEFVRQVEARFEAAATAKLTPGELSTRTAESQRRVRGAVLRRLYLAQKNLEAYIALTQRTGRTAQDCHALATMLIARRKPQEALAWVERGIELDKKTPQGSMAGHDLAGLKRDLLAKLGRGNEALEAAWAEYREHPSKYSYDDLMKYVPKGERATWHERAIEAAKGEDLASLIELLLETKELERLADLVRRSKDATLEDVSHYATEPAAKKLEKGHPGLAARLWCAQGMRIVKAGKSRYYDAALGNFERARRCYEKAGLADEWREVVGKVRSGHRRKTAFMAGLEEIVAGSGPSEKPSFLERAKARWSRPQTEERSSTSEATRVRPDGKPPR
jgi:tetratricopeptide (TPR) repeat protein